MEPVYKYITQLANAQRRLIDRLAKGKPYSGTQGKIIHYLLENEDREVYQKDIEKDFGLRAATATQLIISMEEQGWVERSPSRKDRRLKDITLTKKGKLLKGPVASDIQILVEKMTSGIKDDDLKHWMETTIQMLENLRVTDNE